MINNEITKMTNEIDELTKTIVRVNRENAYLTAINDVIKLFSLSGVNKDKLLHLTSRKNLEQLHY